MADYCSRLVVDNFWRQDSPEEVARYISSRMDEIERETLYQAFKETVATSESGYVSLRLKKATVDRPIERQTEYLVKAEAQPVAYSRIWVPVFSQAEMPSDVRECTWCGGYTKDDARGNCAACGAPRGSRW